MKRMIFLLGVSLFLALFTATYTFAGCGACSTEDSLHEHVKIRFDEVSRNAAEKHGVKEITYKQFQKIRNSGEGYVLVDALSAESYKNGHIKGAVSLPYDKINKKTAAKYLSKSDNIIVYCGGFACGASTKAAQELQKLGYKNVLDNKGGLEEWLDVGHELVSVKR